MRWCKKERSWPPMEASFKSRCVKSQRAGVRRTWESALVEKHCILQVQQVGRVLGETISPDVITETPAVGAAPRDLTAHLTWVDSLASLPAFLSQEPTEKTGGRDVISDSSPKKKLWRELCNRERRERRLNLLCSGGRKTWLSHLSVSFCFFWRQKWPAVDI